MCVELDIAHLAVNSVLNSVFLNDIEGTDFVPDAIDSAIEGAGNFGGKSCCAPHMVSHAEAD